MMFLWGWYKVFLVVWNRSVIMSLVRANKLNRQMNNAKTNPQKMKTLLLSIRDKPIPRHDIKPHSVIGSLIVSRYFPPEVFTLVTLAVSPSTKSKRFHH